MLGTLVVFVRLRISILSISFLFFLGREDESQHRGPSAQQSVEGLWIALQERLTRVRVEVCCGNRLGVVLFGQLVRVKAEGFQELHNVGHLRLLTARW